MATLFLNTFKQVSQRFLWHDRGQGARLGHSGSHRAVPPSAESPGAVSAPGTPSGRTGHPLSERGTMCLSAGRPYHGAGELLAVADVRLAVQPDLGELGDVAEAEGVELERGPVGFPILMHKDGIVRGTPVLCVEKQCQSPHGFSETSPKVTV